jgi:hypothetical protein
VNTIPLKVPTLGPHRLLAPDGYLPPFSFADPVVTARTGSSRRSPSLAFADVMMLGPMCAMRTTPNRGSPSATAGGGAE